MPIEGFSDNDNRSLTTRWLNPTPYTRKVRVCMEGVWRTIRWEPGETIELSAMYDRAIQIVICQEDACNGRGPGSIKCQPCTKGHHGQIMGGQDPLLVRAGRGDIANPTLDPDEVDRQEAAKAAKQIADTQKAITAAMIQANREVAETAAPVPQPSRGKKADASPQG